LATLLKKVGKHGESLVSRTEESFKNKPADL
jgi:hypothetical protein